jgi:hypothetical protein
MSTDLPTLFTPLLSPIGKRVLDPSGPAPLKQLAAKGVAPGMKPSEALLLLILLRDHADFGSVASETLRALPLPLLNGALAGPLPAAVLEILALTYAQNAEIAGKILVHADVNAIAVLGMARIASEPVAEFIATNEERLLANPAIIEALYKNSATRMSTCDRIIELAARNGVDLPGISVYKEVVASLEGEPIPEPTAEPGYDDMAFAVCEQVAASIPPVPLGDDHLESLLTDEVVIKQKVEEVKKRFEDLKTSAKIRIALTTKSASVRNMALRDASPLVRKAAVNAEGFTEADAEAVAARKNAHEDVLRHIGMSTTLTRSHRVKVNLVMNPRTPTAIAQRFLSFLRDHELRSVASSRDVQGSIAAQAKQIIARKDKKK